MKSGNGSPKPQLRPRRVPAGLLSEIAPGIAHRARQRLRKQRHLPSVGMVVDTGSTTSRTQYRGLKEAQECYRSEITDVEMDALALRLGVPKQFLKLFDIGWCRELGAVTVGMIDGSGRIAGIEPIPLDWPPKVVADVWPLHGRAGLIAVPPTMQRGKVLFVSGDWTRLYAAWCAGKNVAYKSDSTLGLDASKAIAARQYKVKARRVKLDLESWTPLLAPEAGAINTTRREGFRP